MVFHGAWLQNFGYQTNDAVTFNGSTYIALTTNSGSEPDLYPGIWAVLAQQGGAGPTGATGAAATLSIGTVTTTAPGTPATRNPISVATIRFGPGAACASPNSAVKSAAVIHPCTSTTWRCISGITVCPPPNASSDNCANSTNNAASVALTPSASTAAKH